MTRRAARFWVVGGTAALGVAACGGTTPPAPPQSPTAPAPSAVAPSPPAARQTTTAPARGTTVEPGAQPATPASPFHVIGELAVDLDLYSAGDRGFLISQQGIELQLVGDEIVQDPHFKRGLPTDIFLLSVASVSGRYPDSLWLSTTQASGRSGFSTLWNWDGKRWLKKQSFSEGYFTWGIEPWVSGRMLVLEAAGMAFDARFHVLGGDGRDAIPQFQKAKPNDLGFCRTHLNPSQFRTLASGEVIVAGQYCDPSLPDQELAVERWAPGSKKSTIDILPGQHAPDDLPSVSYAATGLAVLSPSEMYVSGLKQTWGPDTETREVAYFARFDGARWQVLPAPIPGGVRALWTAPGGALLAADVKGGLWSRSAAGEWSAVPWPMPIVEAGRVQLLGLWPRAAGDIWAVVESSAESHPAQGERAKAQTRKRFLLHTRPAANALPTLEAMDRTERSLSLPGPPVSWCNTRFVLLYTLGRQAPANYDYPATRQALRGHREFAQPDIEFVEFEREGRRYFGARVPDFDVGEKLAKLVKDKVPGATPQLVCHNPVETRKLQLDFAPSAATK